MQFTSIPAILLLRSTASSHPPDGGGRIDMRQVRLLRVVVASPADVMQERKVLDTVIADLNRGLAADRGVRLELLRWETQAFPGFHVDGPQGLIDEVLGIEDCDVLIGIFWKRFGTPVPDAGSGTEHEFRKAYEAWQRQQRPAIMMYFNQKPWTPSTTEETTEWGRVLSFKKDFPHEGLWWSYRGARDFDRTVREHLTQFLRQNVPLPAQEPANQAQAHGGDRGPLTAPAGVEEILGHFDELRRAYARIPSWSRGVADLWRIESLSYRSTVPAIRAGLEKLKRMHPPDQRDVSWALTLQDACDAALKELAQVQDLLDKLRDDDLDPSRQVKAARLLSSHAPALHRLLAEIEARVRGRYPRSAPDSLAADGVESRIEDDDPKHDDTKQALIDAKLALSNRLGEDWRDLANALGIPLRYQRRFESGREAEGIWEWLELRGTLKPLKPALTKVERNDLADELPPQFG